MLNYELIRKEIGNPSFSLNNFHLWIQGRQFPASKDYWDGNWLNAIALFENENTSIKISGSFIHLQEIDNWLKELIILNKSLKGKAELKCRERNLYISLEIDAFGKICYILKLTPNHLNEKHEFELIIDQTFLNDLISSLEKILKEYDIRK